MKKQLGFIAGAVFFAAFGFGVVSVAGQTRAISVITEPNATVWIDGVKYGTTDGSGKLAIASISAGRHSIRVRADGFKEISRPLLAAQKGDIKIALSKTVAEAELAYQQAETLASSDRQKATEAYEKAIKLRPKFPEAFIGLARLYSETGDSEKAENAIRSARKVKPGYAEASVIEGRILKSGGDETMAIAAFKRAIAEGKGFQPEAYTGLGLIYKEKAEGFASAADYAQEAANYAESAKYFMVAVKQLSGAPDASTIYQLLGLVYEQQKKYKEAIAVYEEFLRLFPESAEASAVRSFITQLQKQMSLPK